MNLVSETVEIPQLRIGNLTAKLPIVQGGMGVRVSLAPLAAAVANEGGIGTISSIGLADIKLSGEKFLHESNEALKAEIRKARQLTKGILAVNVMGVMTNVNDLIKSAIQAGINLIAYGAGLPLKIPEAVWEANVSLVPIISSPRAAHLILKTWKKKYNRAPDAFILEGPLAGGHLGFNREELDHIEDFGLDKLVRQVTDIVKPFEEDFQHKIPIIAAGGIFNGKDIAEILKAGASGAQMGTRFVCTQECSASDEFKQTYVNSKKEDIKIVQSPVGLLGRAMNNPFIQRVEGNGRMRIKCDFQCLTACKVDKAKYCIADALLNSYHGNVDEGLIFCGQNAHRVDKITTVHQLMKELVADLKKYIGSGVD